jgi:hypothetical protein
MGYRSDIDALNASKLSDAPTNGKEYVRKNGGWVEASLSASNAFPVGSTYITLTDTNPGTTLGFGTWVLRGTGKALIGG